MKLDTLLCSCNNGDLNPKPTKRFAGKLSGGCYRVRRKPAVATNRGVVVAPRGWFGVVKKKLHVKTKSAPHNKNIIIIHNNTSITSNDEDNRASSCVELGKDQGGTKGKDSGQDDQDVKKKKPGGVVVEEKQTIIVLKEQLKEASVVSGGEGKRKIEGGDDEEPKKTDDKNDDGVVVEEKSATIVEEKPAAIVEVEGVVKEKVEKDEEEDEQVGSSDEERAMAAIRIQTAFRSHLARRAFRALKSLVRLQAVVRGVVVRRQARLALHCMSALVRLGDRVRARQLLSRSSHE